MNGDYLNRICAVCGLTFGSHRADSICRNQCPGHEGKMDWPKTMITTFVDSGDKVRPREIPYGTPSRVR